MAPMLSNLGYKSKRGMAYFATRARGGVGAIVAYGIPPDFFIKDEAWDKKEGRELFLEGIRVLTDEIHDLDTRIGVQLWHANRFPAVIKGNFDGGEWVAPSARIEGSPPHVGVGEQILGGSSGPRDHGAARPLCCGHGYYPVRRDSHREPSGNRNRGWRSAGLA